MYVLVMQADGRTTCKLLDDPDRLHEEVLFAAALYLKDSELPAGFLSHAEELIYSDNCMALNELIEEEEEGASFFWQEVETQPAATHVLIEIEGEYDEFSMYPVAAGPVDYLHSVALSKYREMLNAAVTDLLTDTIGENTPIDSKRVGVVTAALDSRDMDLVSEVWPCDWRRWEVKVLDA